jgi:hypothetical protein
MLLNLRIPNPDKVELKIEDCPPPAEILVDAAFSRRSHRLLWRSLLALSFLKWKEFLKYSIFNRKYSIVTRQRKYSNTIFLPQYAQKLQLEY